MSHSLRLGQAGLRALAIGGVFAVSSIGIVRAEHMQPDGSVTYTCSSGTACVEGDSTSKPYGIYGLSTTTGVLGKTTSATGGSGVAGISSGTAGSAHGVYGRSSNGQGVYGTSSSANGVEGHTTSLQDFAGVAGYAGSSGTSTNTGVYGVGGAAGVAGESSSGGTAVDAQGDDTLTDLFYGIDTANDATCIIDAHANLACTGTVTAGAEMRTQQPNNDGKRVLAYAPESASAAIEDVGTAHMVAGTANVSLDRAFSASIDRNAAYHVFLTPMGDTRGLYVSAKTPAGFEVREAQGGRSTVSFDYRIVAHPLGAAYDRLPPAPASSARRLLHRRS